MVHRLDDKAIEMILWYESRPNSSGTWFNDRKIGHALGWFRGGRGRPQGNPETLSQELAQVDVAMVRNIRRYIDREIDGYYFGTKRNGAGVRWSHLNSKDKGDPETATDAAAAEQFARLSQMEQQHGVEMERDIGKIEALQENYVTAGEVDKAFTLHDAVRDIKNTGRISPATVSEARRLGIPIPVGRWTA